MLVTIGEIIKRFRTEGACVKFSPETIVHMANVIGYTKRRIGGKVGYDKRLITAISQRFKEAVDYEKGLGMKKAQKVAKIQQAHEEATQLEMPTLQMNMPILGTIVTLGTLTALFGTVVGMIRSFAALAATGGGDSAALSVGISEALVNTASGILTSWVAVVAYNYFTNKIDKLTYALDEVGYSIAQTYEANHTEEA